MQNVMDNSTLNELRGILNPPRIRAFRKRQGWKPAELGAELGGYSASYIRSLETANLPITETFADKFRALERRIYADAAERKEIHAKYPLPRAVLILARARKCAGCKRYVILPYANQKYCDADCRKRALHKRKGVKA